MKKILITILCLCFLFLSGCATKPETRKLANSIFGTCSVCSDMFNAPMYQWDSKRSYRGYLVMAYARDKAGACACGTAYAHEVETGFWTSETEQADVNNLAIARCNEQGRQVNIMAPCELFALGDEIVWKKNPETGENDIGLQ
jgi:hypothetical protein